MRLAQPQIVSSPPSPRISSLHNPESQGFQGSSMSQKYRDVVGKKRNNAPLQKKRNIQLQEHPTEEIIESPFQPDQLRRGRIPQQQHASIGDQTKESRVRRAPESAGGGSGLSRRGDSAKRNLLQTSHNTSLFQSASDFKVVDSHINAFQNLIINVNSPQKNENPATQRSTSGKSRDIPNVEMKSSKRGFQTVRKSSEIYYRNLLTLGRGSPLWIPEPSASLPIEYQKAGIGIGDVGILKDSGGFDFLFNVYQPHNDVNHPINPPTMPDGFSPLDPPDERDVNSQVEFKNRGFLTSCYVNSRHDGSSGLTFESSAEDGAILTMPKGASSMDLDNMGMVREYVSKNVQQWYTYANEVRGRDVGNGDLRLVIGKTSATTWGMAAFANESDEGSLSSLKFKRIRPKKGNGDADNSSPEYGWEYSGNIKGEGKCGPNEQEIEKLRNFDRLSGYEGQIAYENQCLFVRTINVTLQAKPNPQSRDQQILPVYFQPLLQPQHHQDAGDKEPGSEENHENASYYSEGERDGDDGADSSDEEPHTYYSLLSIRHSSSSSATITELEGPEASPHLSLALRSAGNSNRASHALEQPVQGDGDGQPVQESDYASPLPSHLHPSKIINEYLLNYVPEATMAITEDEDWISVLQESDTSFPADDILLSRIKDVYDVGYDEGVVFLRNRSH